MKPLNPLGAVLVAVALVGWLMAVPAGAAQNRGPRGGSTSQGSGGSSQGSGGGSTARPAPSGGGRTSGDGGRTSGNGGGTSSGGGTASGRAVPKPSGGSTSGTSDTGTRDNGSGSGDGSTGRTSATARPTSGRSPSSGTAAVGRATPVTAGHGGTTVVIAPGYYGGFYPWGYGGFGFGGYYGGYYGYYDPWLYGDAGYYGVPYRPSGFDEGKLRLKMKPRDAQVYVDGYFAGKVDDFDGVFQRLAIESGPHHISVRADGYEPLELDVQIQPDRTITYSGDLRRLQ